MTVDLFMAYLLMLVSMTLTLMQGHSGSTKANIQCWIISTAKQATSITLATTVGHCSFVDLDFENVGNGSTSSVFHFQLHGHPDKAEHVMDGPKTKSDVRVRRRKGE